MKRRGGKGEWSHSYCAVQGDKRAAGLSDRRWSGCRRALLLAYSLIVWDSGSSFNELSLVQRPGARDLETLVQATEIFRRGGLSLTSTRKSTTWNPKRKSPAAFIEFLEMTTIPIIITSQGRVWSEGENELSLHRSKGSESQRSSFYM